MAAVSAGTRKKIAEAWIEIKPSMNGFFSSMNQQMTTQMNSMKRTMNSSLSGMGSSSSKAFSRSFKAGSSGLSRVIKAPFSGITAVASAAGKTAGMAFSSAMNTATSALKIGAGVGLAAGGLAAGKIATSGLSRALNIEDAEAKLQALKFTSEQIKTISDNAMASVKGTSFAFDQAMKTSVSGLAAGIKEGSQLEAYLKLIADASTVAGADLDEMGYIFNKITANTRAYSQELNMLADRGIPIYSWLAEEMKVSQEELRKMIKAGAISSDAFLATMKKNLGGAATTATSTTRGYVANMNAALARLGAGLLGGSLPIFTEMLKELIPVVDAFTKVSKDSGDTFWERFGEKILPPFKEFTKTLTANIEAGKPLFPFFDKIGEAAGNVFKMVSSFKQGIKILGEWKNALAESDFGKFMSSWGNDIKNFVSHLRPIGEIFDQFILPVVQPFFNLFMNLIPVFQGLATGIMAIVIPLRDLVFTLITEIVEAITGSGEGGGFSALGSYLAGIGQMIGTFISQYGPLVIQLVQAIGTGLGTVIANIFPKVVEVVGNLVSMLADQIPVIIEALPFILEPVQNLVTLLLDTVSYLTGVLGRVLPDLIQGLGPILYILVETIKYAVMGVGVLIESFIFLMDALYNGLAIILNGIFAVINAFGAQLEYVDLVDYSFDTGIFEIGSGNYSSSIPYGMATGGTVAPAIGGTVVRLAEAGKPESVVDTGLMNKNLAYQNQMFENNSSSQPIVIHNTINTTGDVDEAKLAKLIERNFRRSS